MLVVRKPIPNGFSLAVLVPGAFSLINGSCGAPNELIGKLKGRESRLGINQFGDAAIAGQDGKRSGGAEDAAKEFTALQIVPLAQGVLLGPTI